MVTLAYVIVGVLLGGTVLLALVMALAIWGAVAAARPDLMEKRPAAASPPDAKADRAPY